MPYKSDKQRAYMHMFLQGLAKKWDKEGKKALKAKSK